jgi:hypothetical protein
MKRFTVLALLVFCLPCFCLAQVPTPDQLKAISDALTKISADSAVATGLQAALGTDAAQVQAALAQQATDQVNLTSTLATIQTDEAALLAAVQALSPQAKHALLKALGSPVKPSAVLSIPRLSAAACACQNGQCGQCGMVASPAKVPAEAPSARRPAIKGRRQLFPNRRHVLPWRR